MSKCQQHKKKTQESLLVRNCLLTPSAKTSLAMQMFSVSLEESYEGARLSRPFPSGWNLNG